MREADELGAAPKAVTVAEIIADYVNGKRGVSNDGAWRVFRRRGEIVTQGIGRVKMRDLTPLIVKRWRDGLCPRYGFGTINGIVGILRTASRQAYRDGVIPSVPGMPQAYPEPPPRQGFFEHADFVAMHAALPEWAADALAFGYHTGWRRNEILYLEWSEVDLAGGMIHLSPKRSKNRQGRDWPILGPIKSALEKRQGARVLGLPWVFHKDGSKIVSGTWARYWQMAREETGREGLMFHDCRRTMARNFDIAGVRRATAMKLMGHKSESMYRRYNIVNQRDLEDGVGKLNELMDEHDDGKVLPFKKKAK